MAQGHTGTLHIVGLGPGDAPGMTARADAVLSSCSLIVGYSSYLKLLEGRYCGTPRAGTGMKQEIDRVRMAFEAAAQGVDVALVCSGDAGVYGMASPAVELAQEYPGVHLDIVPGVSAAHSGAALLGAPLGHDYAVISLSDLLTPWDVIERRLRSCAAADMAMVLYNPRSRGRAGHLAQAVAAVLDAGADPGLVCGWVRNVGRPGQKAGCVTLAELASLDADMNTTVFIGSSRTRRAGNWIVTPRGYTQLQ